LTLSRLSFAGSPSLPAVTPFTRWGFLLVLSTLYRLLTLLGGRWGMMGRISFVCQFLGFCFGFNAETVIPFSPCGLFCLAGATVAPSFHLSSEGIELPLQILDQLERLGKLGIPLLRNLLLVLGLPFRCFDG